MPRRLSLISSSPKLYMPNDIEVFCYTNIRECTCMQHMLHRCSEAKLFDTVHDEHAWL